MSRETIFAEINIERIRQDKMWGTAFDDKNTLNDWATYFAGYAYKASPLKKDDAHSRAELVKLATMAVAAIEAHDRNGGFPARHYDVPQKGTQSSGDEKVCNCGWKTLHSVGCPARDTSSDV